MPIRCRLGGTLASFSSSVVSNGSSSGGVPNSLAAQPKSENADWRRANAMVVSSMIFLRTTSTVSTGENGAVRTTLFM